jgi:shikimate dehydrogenase
MTTKFCVVGSPIEHSLSPVLHNAAYRHLGLDFSYEKIEIGEGKLAEFIRTNDFEGLSITMPLKLEAFALSVGQSETARITGVANTLFRTAAGYEADNTDVFGVFSSLSEIPTPDTTVLIGSGATAKSAVLGLRELFPDSKLVILARNTLSANELLQFCLGLGFEASIGPSEDLEQSVALLSRVDLVMSLVPAGSYSDLFGALVEVGRAQLGVLFDVAYSPWPSLAARNWSGEIISGIDMLIWQAIAQVEIFVQSSNQDTQINRRELFAVMREAVR